MDYRKSFQHCSLIAVEIRILKDLAGLKTWQVLIY